MRNLRIFPNLLIRIFILFFILDFQHKRLLILIYLLFFIIFTREAECNELNLFLIINGRNGK